MAGGSPTPTTMTAPHKGPKKAFGVALAIMVTLFFMIGFITVLNDVLIPRLKNLFELTNRDAMLVMFVFFSAYLVWGYVGGILVKRVGFKRGMIAALAIVGLGLSLFVPAAHMVKYGVFLFALFVTASGLAILQVCINPYIIALGPPETGASRLNLGGALNSTATFIGPIIGGAFILQYIATPDFPNPNDIELIESAYNPQQMAEAPSADIVIASINSVFSHPLVVERASLEATTIQQTLAQANTDAKTTLAQIEPLVLAALNSDDMLQLLSQSNDVWWAYKLKKADSVLVPYVGLAVVTFLLAIALVFISLPKIAHEEPVSAEKLDVKGSAFDYAHLNFGALAIFFYVGVEVSIGATLIPYLEDKEMGGLDHLKAASLVAYYWGSAMIGRFIGFYVGTRVTAEVILRFVAIAAVVLVLLSFAPFMLNSWADIPVLVLIPSPFSMGFENVTVPWAAICLVLCGLCNSVMWPSIFPLGIAKLGKLSSQGSGIMVSMVFGGAVIPVAIGWIADHYGYKIGYVLCLVCYAYIMWYAIKGFKSGKIAQMSEDELAA